MKKYIGTIVLITLFSLAVFSQSASSTKQAITEKATAASTDATALDVAKATLAAHGGNKLKKMKTLVMKGSMDLNVFNQLTPATFAIAISGDKYSFDINSPIQPLKQVYDGRQTFSLIQGFSLPPITSLGFPVLPRIGDAGYVISAVGETKKKRKGFRITTPDGFYTDFFVDEKTGQIKGYESSYDVGGRIVTTSVEVDEFQTVDGILVPKKYAQRFDLGTLTAYANFKTKEILINAPIADDVFAIPK